MENDEDTKMLKKQSFMLLLLALLLVLQSIGNLIAIRTFFNFLEHAMVDHNIRVQKHSFAALAAIFSSAKPSIRRYQKYRRNQVSSGSSVRFISKKMLLHDFLRNRYTVQYGDTVGEEVRKVLFSPTCALVGIRK